MATPQSDGSIVLTTKVVTTGIQKGIALIKKGIQTATVALTAFGVATGTLVKQSVQAYADYEQLVGGVETLFKDSSKKVIEYAHQAYKTTGQSANEYMQNVTAFSASLLSAVGGDTEKAAEVANAAMISISDNVNKMGSSAESVQLAFQGFAKQQYMLLDNLKLGYGGTKTEMERLLKDAQAITGVEYNIDNLADVYTAIGVIQEKLGIAGTTAKEAATTISGSAATMKAAWQNVLTAISGGGDIDAAIENLVDSVEAFFRNIVPVVERALIGIGAVIERIAPMLIQTVVSAFVKALPQLISALWQMIQGLFQGLKLALTELLSGKPNEIVAEQADKTEETAKNQKQVTKNIKETNKELKKTLAGFDEIQTLSSQAADGADESMDTALQGIGGSFSGGADATLDGSAVVQTVSDTFIEIASQVSGWLMALGCILLVTGNIPWGIGLIVAGAIASEYTEAQVGDGSSLAELAAKIGTVLAIVGAVAIVLGILLCFAQIWGFGIKLIAIGAGSLFGAVALNWDAIVEALQGPIGTITALVSGALLVLGIVLVCCGVIPLGIALIVAGAAGLVTVIALNWDAIVDWVKGAWEAVKGFWNKYIAPVFTAKFWTKLAKTCGNGLIIGFEAAINGIIWLFEGLINLVVGGLNLFIKGVSAVTGAIGDLIGVNLRIPEIPKANLGRISIPRLAQGAVIPPNREFLAVLGDQKAGRNLEAPESLIRQIVREESGNASNITIKATGNMAQLIRLLKLELSQEDDRATVF